MVPFVLLGIFNRMLDFAAALFIGGTTATAYHLFQKARISRIKLKDNCLLTKYPILFISKRRWLPIFQMPKACQYLMAHGYEAIHLAYNGNTKSLLNQALRIHKIYTQVHIFYDSTLAPQIALIHRDLPKLIATSQIIEEKPPSDYLAHAISLAEKDFQCSH